MILDEHLSQNYDYTVKDQYMGMDLIRNCADVPYVVSWARYYLDFSWIMINDSATKYCFALEHN